MHGRPTAPARKGKRTVCDVPARRGPVRSADMHAAPRKDQPLKAKQQPDCATDAPSKRTHTRPPRGHQEGREETGPRGTRAGRSPHTGPPRGGPVIEACPHRGQRARTLQAARAAHGPAGPGPRTRLSIRDEISPRPTHSQRGPRLPPQPQLRSCSAAHSCMTARVRATASAGTGAAGSGLQNAARRQASMAATAASATASQAHRHLYCLGV
jgi:hypothetical protein